MTHINLLISIGDRVRLKRLKATLVSIFTEGHEFVVADVGDDFYNLKDDEGFILMGVKVKELENLRLEEELVKSGLLDKYEDIIR